MNLTTWLRQSPHPTSVLADGKPIQVGSGGHKWSKLAETIDALDAKIIECLDANGGVIRATNLDEDRPAPASSTGTLNDLSDVQVFARLIAEAYEKGTKSYAPLLDSAMQFVEAQSVRLARSDAEIERLRLVNAKLRAELAEGAAAASSGDGELAGLAPMIAGFLQAQAAGAPPEPNGGKKP